jgi:hypothetical protein
MTRFRGNGQGEDLGEPKHDDGRERDEKNLEDAVVLVRDGNHHADPDSARDQLRGYPSAELLSFVCGGAHGRSCSRSLARV